MQNSSISPRKLEPCILVVFGATGDLTQRKLYPALYNLWREKLLPDRFGVVSIGRQDKNPEQLRADIIGSIEQFSRTPHPNGEDLEAFLQMFSYYRLDFNDLDGYGPLKAYLGEKDKLYGTSGNRVYFLAVSPEYFALIARQLHVHGMASQKGSWQRVVVEKPFGQNLSTAIQLNNEVRRTFQERNIFRIDHYLGKECAEYYGDQFNVV